MNSIKHTIYEEKKFAMTIALNLTFSVKLERLKIITSFQTIMTVNLEVPHCSYFLNIETKLTNTNLKLVNLIVNK